MVEFECDESGETVDGRWNGTTESVESENQIRQLSVCADASRDRSSENTTDTEMRERRVGQTAEDGGEWRGITTPQSTLISETGPWRLEIEVAERHQAGKCGWDSSAEMVILSSERTEFHHITHAGRDVASDVSAIETEIRESSEHTEVNR